MTLNIQNQPLRVSRRGFRPQVLVSRLSAVEPCLHVAWVREDAGR